MRKLLSWIGGFAAVLALVIVPAIGYSIYKVYELHKESEAYANSTIEVVASHWSSRELLKRASPTLVKSVTADQLTATFGFFSVLGPLVSREACKGSVFTSASVGQQSRTIGQFVCNEQYQKGKATIKMALTKIGNQWMINDFTVDSPFVSAQKSLRSSNYYWQ